MRKGEDEESTDHSFFLSVGPSVPSWKFEFIIYDRWGPMHMFMPHARHHRNDCAAKMQCDCKQLQYSMLRDCMLVGGLS